MKVMGRLYQPLFFCRYKVLTKFWPVLWRIQWQTVDLSSFHSKDKTAVMNLQCVLNSLTSLLFQTTTEQILPTGRSTNVLELLQKLVPQLQRYRYKQYQRQPLQPSLCQQHALHLTSGPTLFKVLADSFQSHISVLPSLLIRPNIIVTSLLICQTKHIQCYLPKQNSETQWCPCWFWLEFCFSLLLVLSFVFMFS